MVSINWSWVQRRWYEFRLGHSTYLSLFLSLTNFLLIAYNFLVSQVPILSELFSSILVFAVLFVIVYVPFTSYVGHLHTRKQLSTDFIVSGARNPYYAAILEKLDKIDEELQEMRES